MSTLFVAQILADEQRVPSHDEVLSILDARGKLSECIDLIEEGIDPDEAKEMLRSATGRADLFERACESYSALFEEDLREAVAALREPRLDERIDVNLFNLRFAWPIATLLLPQQEAPSSRCLRVELVAVHPNATLPDLTRPLGPEEFGRFLVADADSVEHPKQRIAKRLERFGKGAFLDPSKLGEAADEEAGSIVWLANHAGPEEGDAADPSLKKAAEAYDFHDYHTVMDLFFHPSWLEKPHREPFDSTAFEPPLT